MDGPRMHGFLFLRVPAGRRTSHEAGRVREALESAASTPGVAGLYTYSLVGLRGDADLGAWIAAAEPDAYQEAARRLLQTDLELTWSLWGFVRSSQYTGRDGTNVKIPGERRRFLVVYPFSKTHEWYQMAPEIRRTMMMEHSRFGHSFDDIEQLLLYCTGLADWEFVVGYETDDLTRFQELVTGMRSTAGRPYTLRDTPTFAGRYGSVEDTLRRVFG
jgi:chlorite dismutase